MTDFLPGEKIVGPDLMHEDRREVAGKYLRPFGTGQALLIEQDNGIRCVIDADEARYLNPRMSDSLRNLADVLDDNTKLAQWFSFRTFGRHLAADEATQLDEFAEMFGVDVHPAGDEYVEASTQVGPIELRLQAYTADYEKAQIDKKPAPGGDN